MQKGEPAPARRAASRRGIAKSGRASAEGISADKLFGRMTDALAADGDEGRGKRRYSTARRRRPVTRGSPNGATPQGDPCDPGPNP